MIKGSIKVSGLKEAMSGFEELSSGVQKGVLRRVAMKSMEPMLDAARGLAPDDPESGNKIAED
jgi:hypothetical protein